MNPQRYAKNAQLIRSVTSGSGMCSRRAGTGKVWILCDIPEYREDEAEMRDHRRRELQSSEERGQPIIEDTEGEGRDNHGGV